VRPPRRDDPLARRRRELQEPALCGLRATTPDRPRRNGPLRRRADALPHVLRRLLRHLQGTRRRAPQIQGLSYCASVTFVRPAGWAGSKPFARASEAANSWPGTTDMSGDSTDNGASGTGSRNAASATSSAALPVATSVALARRA